MNDPQTLQAENQRLQNELQQTQQAFDQFVYLASHDLSNPINQMASLSTWLIEDMGDAIGRDNHENLLLIHSRAKRARKMIDDLLIYSRIGKKAAKPSCFNFRSAITLCIEQLGINRSEISCNDEEITLPPQELIAVMNQLLSNAQKHAIDDDLVINIRYQRGKKRSSIRVTDNGSGIAAKQLERIFAPFTTLKSRDEVEGSGMGLAIARKIVEVVFHGQIYAESSLSVGSSFIIEWPTIGLNHSG